jgi:hypothetical protein
MPQRGTDQQESFKVQKACILSTHSLSEARRRRERADLVVEASLKDIELFVDRHLVKLAFGNLLFQKDKFAPKGEVRISLVQTRIKSPQSSSSFTEADNR